MLSWFKKYWLELVALAFVTVGLMICLSPDFTWINTDSDGIHYTYSARWLYPAHKTSAPVFLLLGHAFIKLIPVGTDAWRMGLILVISTVISCIWIYLIVRTLTKERWLGIIGGLIYGTSALVISQSTIVDTYALDVMLSLGAVYFCLIKKWKIASLFMGAGLATHMLTLLTTIPLFIHYKELRPSIITFISKERFGEIWHKVNIKKYNIVNYLPLLITLVFLVFYAYIPLTNRAPYMWQADPNIEQSGTILNMLSDTYSTILMLVGGLSIWELPKRILDTICILGVSIAVLPLGYIGWYAWINRFEPWKSLWLWLFILPIILFATNLAPQTCVYMIPSIAYGAIIAMIVTKNAGMFNKYRRFNVYWTIGTVCLVVAFGIYNFNSMDIGRTLDKNLSASNFYYKELEKIPDGQILVPNYDWEWAAVFRYNKEFNRDIKVVCISMLPSQNYRIELQKNGINLDTVINLDTDNTVKVEQTVVRSIIELQNNLTNIKKNNNIWTTISTYPETYGSKIVRLTEPNQLRLISDYPGIITPTWKWKPSNPYDFITGAIEVTEWNWVIKSNYSILTFFMMAVCGLVPVWIIYMVVFKKKKFKFQNKHKKLQEV